MEVKDSFIFFHFTLGGELTMTRHFSFTTTLRRTPPTQLCGFFQTLGIDVPIPWDKLKSREIRPIINGFEMLPRSSRQQAEGHLREINSLACQDGLNALREAAEIEKLGPWEEMLPSNASFHAKAMWMWTQYPRIFEKALAIQMLNRISWWRRIGGLPRISLFFSEERKRELEHKLHLFFKYHQGRGDICTVTCFDRGNGQYYFLCRLDDHVKNLVIHDDEGEAVSRAICKTFAVAYCYDRNTGTLTLSTQATRVHKPELENIFVTTVLETDSDILAETPFDLNVIKNPNFTFATDPADGVRVEIEEIHLLWPGVQDIAFRRRNKADTLTRFRACLNSAEADPNEAIVTRIKLRFYFTEDGKERESHYTFEIAAPRTFTIHLGDQRKVELIHKYLLRWRIDHEVCVDRTPLAS